MSDRAIGYGRKSFDDPDQRTSSVDDQRMFAHGYAERLGFELVAFHSDNGITGATMERLGLPAVMRGEAVDRRGNGTPPVGNASSFFDCLVGFEGCPHGRRSRRRSRAVFVGAESLGIHTAPVF